MNICDVCGQEVNQVYITFDEKFENTISGHKHCIMNSFHQGNAQTVSLNPFADQEEMENLQKERDRLLDSLSEYAIPQDEQKFLIRKIKNISDKLVEKARYMKDLK